MTSEERVQRNLEKRQRQIDARDAATRQQWRPIDPKQECFLIDELPPADAFLTLNIRRPSATYLDIFTKFVTDEVADKLFASLSIEDTILSYRKNGSPHCFAFALPLVWQTLAVQVRMIGEQQRSTENNPQPRFLRKGITAALNHFKTLDSDAFVTRCEVVERLNARMVMTEDFSAIISKNFQGFVRTLGQYVAGDEKLFHYTGKSGNVRLVISKPDRVGFWFYELCGRFSNGLPYMLDVFMHNSLTGTVHVASVVRGWIDAMTTIHSRCGDVSNMKCILAMDSYYMDNAARQICQERGIYYCCSVNEKSFSAEVRAVRPVGTTDETGQWHGMYNETTKQLFVYHYDTQKGVGKKYNFSYGFIRSTDRQKIRQHQNRIPAYDNYKTFFECCDNFNRALKDKTWPHKRGSRGLLGESGVHHDFLLGCILQNTFNAWHDVTGRDPNQTSFKDFCVTLSEQLFLYSQTYVVMPL